MATQGPNLGPNPSSNQRALLRFAIGEALFLQLLGDEERLLQSLIGVEARIAMSMIAI